MIIQRAMDRRAPLERLLRQSEHRTGVAQQQACEAFSRVLAHGAAQRELSHFSQTQLGSSTRCAVLHDLRLAHYDWDMVCIHRNMTAMVVDSRSFFSGVRVHNTQLQSWDDEHGFSNAPSPVASLHAAAADFSRFLQLLCASAAPSVAPVVYPVLVVSDEAPFLGKRRVQGVRIATVKELSDAWRDMSSTRNEAGQLSAEALRLLASRLADSNECTEPLEWGCGRSALHSPFLQRRA